MGTLFMAVTLKDRHVARSSLEAIEVYSAKTGEPGSACLQTSEGAHAVNTSRSIMRSTSKELPLNSEIHSKVKKRIMARLVHRGSR